MVLTADQQRVKSLLTETVTLLCRNGLHFQSEFSIEGLLGITVDRQDVFLVNIKEMIQIDQSRGVKTGIANEATMRLAGGEPIEMTGGHSRERRRQKSTENFAQSAGSRGRCLTSEVHRRKEGMLGGAVLLDGVGLLRQGDQEEPAKVKSLKESEKELNNSESNSSTLGRSKNDDRDWLREIAENDVVKVEGKGSTRQSVDDVRDLSCPEEDSIPPHVNHGESKLALNESSKQFPNMRHRSRKRRRSDSIESSDFLRRAAMQRDVSDRFQATAFDAQHYDNDVIHVKEESLSDSDDKTMQTKTAEYLDYLALCVASSKVGDGESMQYRAPPGFVFANTAARQMGRHVGCVEGEESRSMWTPESKSTIQPSLGSASQRCAAIQVELVPGSGVYVDAAAYWWMESETQLKGSRLVRRLVHELWPDERVLAVSSCLGQSTANRGLDHCKVDAIKAYVQYRVPDMAQSKIVLAINECCRDARSKLRRFVPRQSDIARRFVYSPSASPSIDCLPAALPTLQRTSKDGLNSISSTNETAVVVSDFSNCG